jgi:hypothetical protein
MTAAFSNTSDPEPSKSRWAVTIGRVSPAERSAVSPYPFSPVRAMPRIIYFCEKM